MEGAVGSRVRASLIRGVRAFNRFYTARIGVVQAGVLGTDWSLAEARVLFELDRRRRATAGEMAADLGIDPGQLSRLLAGLRRRGLVRGEAVAGDRRKLHLRLTPKGRRAFGVLDRRAAREVEAMLAPLPRSERTRLRDAMGVLEGILAPRKARIVLRRPRAGDYGWIIHRHGRLYREEYGWNEEFEALVARILGDFAAGHDPRRERAWIAEGDGRILGCVFCVGLSRTVAQLRCLLVEPEARGRGLGTRLVDACIRFARRAGYRRMVLWTNDVLHAARRVYERSGFALEKEEPFRGFGHDLTSQTWARPL